MNYIIVRAKSQEEFLEILSRKMTSREKYLDDERLIHRKGNALHVALICSFLPEDITNPRQSHPHSKNLHVAKLRQIEMPRKNIPSPPDKKR